MFKFLKDEDIKHKETFNFEKYNKDVVEYVDKHNEQLKEYYRNKNLEEIEYRAKHFASSLTKKSTFINWREGQYEEIFGHS